MRVVTFRTSVTATGLAVPAAAVEELDAGTQVPVRVTVNRERYSATVRRRGDGFVVRMGEGHRSAAGVEIGEEVEVTLEHEPGHRVVEVPGDLAAALADAGLREAFDALAWSSRKEHARSVTEAGRSTTRERRVARVVEKVRRRA